MSSRSLSRALLLALLAGVAFCGWLYCTSMHELENRERELTAVRGELAPLRKISAEIDDFQSKKGELQKRIDGANQLKLNQIVPSWQFDVIQQVLASPGLNVDEAELTDRLAMQVSSVMPASLAATRSIVEQSSLRGNGVDAQSRIVFDSPAGNPEWRLHVEKRRK